MTDQKKARSDNAHIVMQDMTFRRGNRKIFDGLSLDIERGKVTAILGGSGTGKTTLLNLIGGRLRPESGDVLVDGKSVPTLKTKELYELRKHMGLLFQSGALLTDLSAFENVAFPIREHTQLSESMIRHIVLFKLQLVGLRGARDLMPAELSGGMARRVALARAISLDPGLVMYDEPFTGLDPISLGITVKLIRELNDALGMTAIVVTHDVEEALSIADYLYLLGGGKVIAQGTAEEMRQSESEQVKQFMNGLPDGPVPFHYPADEYMDDLMGVKR
ncbi:MAG: ATP-binding cassette domain-containing protein [Proteobacteria bacterium]|nr:ATP-binding cassette domain-containing protein [Pseudomonadota bacterium]